MMPRLRWVALLFCAANLLAGVGQAQTSTSQNPSFQFSSPGQKQVTLKACNASGCMTVMKTVTVLDPTPVILTSLVGATVVEAGQLVNLTSTGRGQPPLTYTWKITSLIAPEIDVQGSGAFWDTSGVAPGLYTVQLHLQNSIAGIDSLPTVVAVAPETAKSFYTVTPCRVLDTRQTHALASGSPLTFAAAGISAFACGIPATAKALSVNLTAVAPTGSGFISLFPGNYPTPAISTINFSSGQTRTNNAIMPLSSDGGGTLAAQSFVANNGTVQLIVDVNGYFM